MIGFGEFWELDVALLALNSFAQAAFAQASSSTGRAQTAKQQSSARWTTLPDIDLPEDRFMFAVSCCILIICFYKDIPVPAKKQAGIGTNRRNLETAHHLQNLSGEVRIIACGPIDMRKTALDTKPPDRTKTRPLLRMSGDCGVCPLLT